MINISKYQKTSVSIKNGNSMSRQRKLIEKQVRDNTNFVMWNNYGVNYWRITYTRENLDIFSSKAVKLSQNYFDDYSDFFHYFTKNILTISWTSQNKNIHEKLNLVIYSQQKKFNAKSKYRKMMIYPIEFIFIVSFHNIHNLFMISGICFADESCLRDQITFRRRTKF